MEQKPPLALGRVQAPVPPHLAAAKQPREGVSVLGRRHRRQLEGGSCCQDPLAARSPLPPQPLLIL